MKLNQPNLRKWIDNQIYFFRIPIVFYIAAVLATVSAPNHILTIKDFAITNVVKISFLTYVLSGALDYLRKLRAQ
jgi:hypothetical protein